jgi:hypothetical protein
MGCVFNGGQIFVSQAMSVGETTYASVEYCIGLMI